MQIVRNLLFSFLIFFSFVGNASSLFYREGSNDPKNAVFSSLYYAEGDYYICNKVVSKPHNLENHVIFLFEDGEHLLRNEKQLYEKTSSI
jgi:hypothetical protein